VRARGVSALLPLFEHQRIFDESGVLYVLTCFFLVTFAAETNFPFVGKLLVLTDIDSAVRSFHGNCESQPVKQSR
jgi:hypothetical protein